MVTISFQMQTLHYTMFNNEISTLKTAKVFKRYIDDINWIKRLCKRDCDYLEHLKGKYLKPYCCKDLVKDLSKITKEWKHWFRTPL